MDCASTGGSNNTTMEWLVAYSSTYNHSSNQTIDIGWSAGELIWDNNITYNVTVDIYGYNFTTNSTSIVWSDYSEFSPSSNETNGTFYIPQYTLTNGCYFASLDLLDADDGMMFDYDGFEFGVNIDCEEDENSTGGSGNNSTSNAHCLILDNFTMNQTNYVTVDLVNTCTSVIYYPGINASADSSEVTGLSDIWWYMMGNNNSTIQMGWQLSINETIQNGTVVILHFEAFILGCGPNNSWNHDCPNSELYYQFSVSNNNTGPSGGGNYTGVDNVTFNAEIEKVCWESTEVITIDLEIYGLNMSQIFIEWEITNPSTGEIYASNGEEPTIGGLVNVDADGTVFYTWQFEAGSAWLPTEPGTYEIMINPADVNLSNLFYDPLFFTIDIGCNNNTTSIYYNAQNLDSDDCVVSGDALPVGIVIQGNPNHTYMVNWQIIDAANGANVGTYSQEVNTSNNGSLYFIWNLDTTNLTDGWYEFHMTNPNGTSYHFMFTFKVGCSGCGYDSSLISADYEIWSQAFGTIFSSWNQSTNANSANSDTPQLFPEDSVGYYIVFSCLEFGEDYAFGYDIDGWGAAGYFTNSNTTHWWEAEMPNIPLNPLPIGEYNVTLTLSKNNGSDVVFSVTHLIEIISMEDWDGCGTNTTYLDHLQTVSGNPFVQQNLVFLTTSNIWIQNYVDCLVIGENYTMETIVTKDGGSYMGFSDNFTVYQFSDITQWSWNTLTNWQTDIPVGNYCVETTIHSTDSTYTLQIAQVSSLTDCFAVVNATVDNWWDQQTNNSTGTPNNPVMPGTNCSDLNNTLSGLNLTNAWNMTDCENQTGFWFNLTVNGTGVNWYDPIYAVGYDYEIVSGPNFASVVVPPGYGDDKYDLYLWDGSEYVLAESDLDALTQYWFTDDGGVSTTPGDYDGVTMFSIRGLELDAKLNPDDPNAFVTGLTFAIDPNEMSEVILSMNPITVSDEDDDGIVDEDDNCVNDSNPTQADSDSDGVGDACEESASSGEGENNDDDGGSDGESSNLLTYAAILSVALVFILVLFGREED